MAKTANRVKYQPGKVVVAAIARTLGDLDVIEDDGLKVPQLVRRSVHTNLQMLAERMEDVRELLDEIAEIASTGYLGDEKVSDAVFDWAAAWAMKLNYYDPET